MLNLRHLSYFIAVVEAGSVSRAAQVIHIAQPSLSQQIRDLESEVGAQLLLRSSRGVRPTPAGEIVYREALAIVRRVAEIPDLVQQPAGEVFGPVAVGMSTTIASLFATEILSECAESVPGVRIVLKSSDSLQVAALITERAADVGVVFEAEPLPRLARRPLYRQRLFVIGTDSEAVAAASADLSTAELVLPGRPNLLRIAFDEVMAGRQVIGEPVAEATTFADSIAAVRSGLRRVTLLPSPVLTESMSGMVQPVVFEPAVELTATLISSEEFPMTRAAEAVAAVVERVIVHRVQRGGLRGTELIERGITS